MVSSCVRLSVTSRRCIETAGRIELGFWRECCLPPCSGIHCVSKEIWIMSVLSSGTLSQTRKFRHSRSIVLSTKLDGRARWLHYVDYSAPEVTTLWRYTNLFIIIIIITCDGHMALKWRALSLPNPSDTDRQLLSTSIVVDFAALQQRSNMSSSHCNSRPDFTLSLMPCSHRPAGRSATNGPSSLPPTEHIIGIWVSQGGPQDFG